MLLRHPVRQRYVAEELIFFTTIATHLMLPVQGRIMLYIGGASRHPGGRVFQRPGKPFTSPLCGELQFPRAHWLSALPQPASSHDPPARAGQRPPRSGPSRAPRISR
jgi:hypothetical protein